MSPSAQTGSYRLRFRMGISLSIVLLILILFLIQASFIFLGNRNLAYRSADTLIDRTAEVLLSNLANRDSLVSALKEDYIVRCTAAAYILQHSPEIAHDLEELRRVAAYLQVDELHLFDSRGTIVSGTNPEYYGISMEDGEQIGFFRPMLSHRDMTLCQDVTPNTASQRPMMYAMVWQENGKYLVQVGLEPKRLLEDMQASQESVLIQNMPVEKKSAIIVADSGTGEILGASYPELLGQNLSVLNIAMPESGTTAYTSAVFREKSCYCAVRVTEPYCICVLQGVGLVNEPLIPVLWIMAVYLSLSAIALILVLWKSSDALSRERELHLREQQDRNALLQAALTEAEVASRAKTTFLFNMSHDIRTPMNAILGFTDLALRHCQEPERVCGYLEKIRQSGNLLLHLINDVLDLGRIESGKTQLSPAPFDLNSAVSTARDLFSESMAENGLTFTVDSHLQNPDVVCDGLRLDQIVTNLLSNAQKFTPRGGTVEFSLNQVGKTESTARFVLTVRDNGIGMAEDFVPRAFDSFERAQTSTVTGIQGTGLGLSIVKRLVDAMGGEISLTSAPGKGTTFRIQLTFPLAPHPEPRQELSGSRPFRPEDCPLLLVEDNALNREIAEELLTAKGFPVVTAANGQQAVDRVASSRPGEIQLILMDIQMPVMDGYAAARAIRALADPRLSQIPILALTANAFESDRKNALSAGMNGHVSKPIQADRLYAAIRDALLHR